jgi:hypothetical protein
MTVVLTKLVAVHLLVFEVITFERNVMTKLVGGDFELFLKRTKMVKVILVSKQQPMEIYIQSEFR